MREVVGNIWDFDCLWRVIPTNGFVKTNHEAVMGAGLAKQAAKRYPNLPQVLGRSIEAGGNKVRVIRHDLIAFPTKENWWEESDIALVAKSAYELSKLVEQLRYENIALPRVGCGNGGLRWAQVKEVLEAFLDERFTIVDNS